MWRGQADQRDNKSNQNHAVALWAGNDVVLPRRLNGEYI